MIPAGAHVFTCRFNVDGEPYGEPFDIAVVSYRMPDELTSKALFVALTKGRNIDASVWRASDPTYTEWFLHVCGETEPVERLLPEIERVPRVEPFPEYPEAQAWALVLRRQSTMIDATRKAIAAGRNPSRVEQTAHYGDRRGAWLTPTGEFEIRRIDG